MNHEAMSCGEWHHRWHMSRAYMCQAEVVAQMNTGLSASHLDEERPVRRDRGYVWCARTRVSGGQEMEKTYRGVIAATRPLRTL